MTVTLLIVDDHPLVRDGFRFLAEARSEIEVVGEATTADDAVEAARRLRPDVVVMDVELDDGDGIDATARIRRELPDTRVLFVTMHADEATVLAALDAGGTGFVQKGAAQDDLVRAILGTAAGDVVLGPHIGEIVTARIPRSAPAPLPVGDLTAREREIVELLAAGKPNGTIASELGVSRKTVANHVANILMKLGAVDRGQAIVLAREAGYGQRDHRRT